MSRALINNGDTGLAVRTALNGNFTELYQRPAYTRPRPVLLVDGDSKALEPGKALQWANARARFDVQFGASVIGGAIGGTGTTNSQIGGLNNLLWPARLASMVSDVSARVALGQIVDMYLTIGTNDLSGAAITGGVAIGSEAVIANLEKYWNSFNAAGGRYLWLNAIDPRGATDDIRIGSYNAAYRKFALSTPGIFFVDTTPYLIDPADSNGCLGGTGAAAGSAMDNLGLHCGAYGCYLKSYAVERAFRKVYETRDLLALDAGDAYDSTNSVRGNLPSKNFSSGNSGTTVGTGRMLAIGGTSSITNSGSGTITGTPPLGFTASGTLTNDMSVTFSNVTTCPLLEAYIGDGVTGFHAVQVAITGTPSADGFLKIRRQVNNADFGTVNMEIASLFECNALTGIFGIDTESGVTAPGIYALGAGALLGTNSGTTRNAWDQLPALTGLFNPSAILETTASASADVFISLVWKSGITISGTIILIGVSLRPETALPAPTP